MHFGWRWAAVSTVLLASALPAAVPAAAASPAGAPVSPEAPVIVRFVPGADAGERAVELEDRGLRVVDQLPGSDFALVVPEPGAAVRAGDGGVIEDVDPLVTVRAFGVPNDPFYNAQWHLPAIDAAAAWDVTTGTGTIVAVLDSGVAYEDHDVYLQAPDLAETRFVAGWDFVDGDGHANDQHGHGTHVAGTIAQSTGNGRGVAGVAPGAGIMPLRVLDAAGAGSDWNVAQALRFAADHGATVANLSLGSQQPSAVLADAVVYASSKGVTIVAASGNDGLATVSYPAALPGVIAVGAVRLDLTRPAYSNHGAALDLVAPGGDVSLDQDGDGYPDGILQQTLRSGSTTSFCLCYYQGTSMAAPHVAGVAALVASRGITDPAAVEAALVTTAVDLGPAGWDDAHGHGLVQAGAAVRLPLVDELDIPATVPTRGIDNACPAGAAPATTFTDIAGDTHAAAITCVAWWKIAGGVTSTSFVPAGPVTRGQLASFVGRTVEAAGVALPVAPPNAFSDDDGSVHEGKIDQLAALGIVRGRVDGTYGHEALVTRAEMATVLVRAHDVVVPGAPLAAGPDRFSDDQGSVHEESIDKAAAAGLAGGTGPTTFAPSGRVSRGQMATFLGRTLDLFVGTGVTPAR